MKNTDHTLRVRDQIMAMRDASMGVLEAARRRYETLKVQAEQVSIHYVYGRAPRDTVRLVTQRYLEAESALHEAVSRVRINQRALDEINQQMRTVRWRVEY